MIVEIQYKDKIAWKGTSNDKSWTHYSKKFKESYIQPSYIAPVIVKDSWNGKEYDVQHVYHDAFYFEIFLKSSELDAIRELKSCSDVNIISYDQTSGGSILNKAYTDIDLMQADYLDISEPERADTTTGWKTGITFRTNRTVIDKALPVLDTNKVLFQGSKEWIFKSPSPFEGGFNLRVSALDSNNIAVIDVDETAGGNYLTKYTSIDGVWTQVGNTLVVPLVTYIRYYDVTSLETNSVAILLGTRIVKYTFNGTDWIQSGNISSIPAVSFSFGYITALSSSRTAMIDPNGDLIVMDFDGSDWTQVGSTFNIPSSGTGYRDLSAMSETRIVYIDRITSELRSYDFDETTWTLHKSLAVSTFNAVSIAALSDTRVVTNIRDNTLTFNGIRSYTLEASGWVEDPGYLSVPVENDYPDITSLDSLTVFATTNSTTGIYNFNGISFSTDYDVVNWVKQTEDLLATWKGAQDTVIQSISKVGKEILLYLKTSDYDDFVSGLKNSLFSYINGTQVTEVEYEASVIGEDLYRIVVRGVSGKEITYKGDPVDNLNYVRLGGIYFYTDFPVDINEKKVENVEVEWPDGSLRVLQSIYKKTNALRFYYKNEDVENIQFRFVQAALKYINGTETQEAELVTETVGDNYNSVTITAVVSITKTTNVLYPDNTFYLIINDGVNPAFNFITDYPIYQTPEAPLRNTVSNQTGVDSVTKAITKTVKQAKFYLPEADAFSLKQKVELFNPSWSMTLNGETVLQIIGNVEPNMLGTDVYEVVVNCLIDTETV